jgi:hypothetical protein
LPERVREPTFLRALGIQLAAVPAGSVALLVLGAFWGTVGQAAGVETRRVQAAVEVQCLPLGVVVLGALLAAVLPTTFSQGLLVALCCALLAACVAGLFAAVSFATSAASQMPW